MRFDVNVSMLFAEWAFVDRFSQAARAGFEAVEFWWPRGEDLSDVVRAITDAQLAVALFNFDAGDMAAGERGVIANPSRVKEFRSHVPLALDLARQVACRTIHAPIGLQLDGVELQEQMDLARDNVRWAADRARNHGVTVLIEALNTFDNGPYLLANTAAAASFVESVGRDNVDLLYDVYHMQRMEGQLADTLRRYAGLIRHVQIADAPGRGRPGTGEIDFRSVFGTLDGLGYRGYVGLEYLAAPTSTEESLRWLPWNLRGAEVSAASVPL